MDGLRRALEQVVQRQVGGDDVADARDQRQALGAALLPLVAARVLDRDGRVAGEQRRAPPPSVLVEAPRCAAPMPKKPRRRLPQDRHRDYRVTVALPGQTGFGTLAYVSSTTGWRRSVITSPASPSWGPDAAQLARGQAVLGRDLHVCVCSS